MSERLGPIRRITSSTTGSWSKGSGGKSSRKPNQKKTLLNVEVHFNASCAYDPSLTTYDGVKSKITKNSDEVLAYSYMRISDENQFLGSKIIFSAVIIVERSIGRQRQGVASKIPVGHKHRELTYRHGSWGHYILWPRSVTSIRNGQKKNITGHQSPFYHQRDF